MRNAVALGLVASAVAVGGCVEELELPPADACELLVQPETAAPGDTLVARLVCDAAPPPWVEFDFGDGSELVRTAAVEWEHVVAAGASRQRFLRVQAFYPDASGALVRVAVTLPRR
ncbi:MAG: hypothetical protein D6689_18410 [Deltaproteobacteria bacterium]|nr:MAG: hypothetical protein D6689_18410 [Deltaproteobacteria bacterium]